MRSPLKAYWFISAERYRGGNPHSKHYRVFSTGRFTKPENAIKDAIKRLADDVFADESNFIVTSFNRL